MNSFLDIQLFVVGMFIGILICLEVGRRIGIRYRHRNPSGGSGSWGSVVGAMFALLGLLIAFTFSGAASRFDQRRELIVKESNAIGTAYLRLDLLPSGAQPKLRETFRQYVDARLEIVALVSNEREEKAVVARAAELQEEIWTLTVSACRDAGSPHMAILVLPAVNEMLDLATLRMVSMRVHQPMTILGMVALLALVCSLLSGYDMSDGKPRSWIHTLCFAGILSMTMFVILDLEHPRMGFIRIDAADQVLVDVREHMNAKK